MVTCQSANQLKTPAKVSWAFKMVSQFGSQGYTIMGKTADLTVVQKTIIDTLHKEGVKVDVFQTCNRTHSDCLPVVACKTRSVSLVHLFTVFTTGLADFSVWT